MEISCPGCQRRFLIPDDKLPSNAKAVVTCPNCKGKIPVDTTLRSGAANPLRDADREGVIEFFEEGTKKGLVCVPDDSMKHAVVGALGPLGYKTSTADDLRSFFGKVRYNQYDVLVVSERFAGEDMDNSPVLKYLELLPMSIRRNTLVVLISTQHRTLDALMAFCLSVDAIVNESDLSNMQEILRKSLVQHKHFYRTFREQFLLEGHA